MVGHKRWKLCVSSPMPSKLDKFDKRNWIGSWKKLSFYLLFIFFGNPKISRNKVNHSVEMMSEFHQPKLLYLGFFLILLRNFAFMFGFLSNQIYERRCNKLCPFILSARCSGGDKQSIMCKCPKHHNFFCKIFMLWL